MGYISDMSSEARPRSLPAVVVRAGLIEGDAPASWASREDSRRGGCQRQKPHSPSGWLDEEMHVFIHA